METLRLSDPASGVHIDIPVPENLVSAFRAQVERDVEVRNPLGLQARIENHLIQAVVVNLDYELQPPSTKQLRYAGRIAGRLRIQIPAEALASKSVMAGFISRHVDWNNARIKRTKRVTEVTSLTIGR